MVDAFVERVAGNVRAEMARKRATREDLARIIGTAEQPVHTETVARRLRGDIEFSARELSALAEYFGVPVAALLGEDGVRAS